MSGGEPASLRSRLAALLAPLLILSSTTIAVAGDEGIFELRIASTPAARAVRVMLTAAGEPLFPLIETASLLELPMTAQSGSVALDWPPGQRTSRVDLETLELTIDGKRHEGPDIVVYEGEIYLPAPLLVAAIGGEARLDWENLALVLSGDYPVVVRTRNEERRSLLKRPGMPEGPDVPYAARSGGMAGAWSLSGIYDDFGLRGGARAALATALFGGSLEGGGDATVDDVAKFGDSYVRYSRAFPRTSWIRQLEIGDVRGGGIVSRPFRGISLSNEPLYTPDHYGEALIHPVVPAGWEYELYQGDYLLGVSAPGGSPPVAAPIGYGTTPIRVRMIGPSGEERTEVLTFLVPTVQVPEGEWRYAAGAGSCESIGCEELAYVDLRRGITRRLTAGLGLNHTTHDNASERTRPHGMLSLLLRPDLRIEFRAKAEALAHLTLQQSRRSSTWRVAGGWQREEGTRTLPDPVWFADANGAIHLGSGRSVIVSGRFRGLSENAPDQWQAGVITGFPRFQAGASYERGFQESDVVSLTGRAFVPRRSLSRIGEWSTSGRIDLGGNELRGGAIVVTALPSDRFSVTAGAAWHRHETQPELSLSFVLRTPAAYVQSSNHANAARSGGFVSASGGVALDAGGFLVDPYATMDRTGARGFVFIDEDGDGVRDDGEAGVAGVTVLAGGARTITGAGGAYAVWGMQPYAVVSISVDRLSIPRTDLVPVRAEQLLRLSPNVYGVADIPLLRTREVSGRVIWSGGKPAPGGVTVEARRRGSDVPERTQTFSDGVFYFQALPAGDYTISIAGTSLEMLGAALDGEPHAFVVRGGTEAVIAAPVLVLRQK